ncbi:MAG: leucine-rich repeat domain-containing protein [Clostridiales bacterium]|nr:leucine-rich repeat domain-containing protein [Clostridiales bacterium]
MKKFLAITTCLCLLLGVGLAEDYSSYSKEELDVKRQELIRELSLVSSAYGAMVKTEKVTDSSDESLGTIQSLFPDEYLAMAVRDGVAKFSINQTVTQKELDTVTQLWLSNYSGYLAADLTGIGYLKNLEFLDLRSNPNCTVIPDEIGELTRLKKFLAQYSNITSLPESIGNLVNLEKLYLDYNKALTSLPENIGNLVNLRELTMSNTSLNSLPENIGNLVNLRELNLSYTSLNSLPESICNCTNLTALYIPYTNVSSLPDNIGNLVNLKTLSIGHTNISSLPESIWGLTLTYLDMSGTSVK